eukprot:gene5291-6433_t
MAKKKVPSKVAQSDGSESDGDYEEPSKSKAGDNDLQREVADFAAQLGLAASVDGFNDRDFRPKTQDLDNFDDEDDDFETQPAKEKKTEKDAKKDKKDNVKKSAALSKDITGRVWKESVGPRPTPAKKTDANYAKEGSRSLEDKLFGTAWYDVAKRLPQVNTDASEHSKADEELLSGLVKKAKERGQNLIDYLGKTFERQREKDNPQENVPANMRSLDALLALATSKGKRQAAQAIEVLCELFSGCVLPDRKLKFLFEQPLYMLPDRALEGKQKALSTKDEAVQQLVLWYVEDEIKTR